MASVYDRYLALKAAQQLNQPDASDRAFNRMDREHSQMIQSQGMTLEYQKLAEQKKQAEFDRYKDLIAIEAEYGAAMGQETKSPTDPRLTQTHKAATTKGKYRKYGADASAMAAQQKAYAKLLKDQQAQQNYLRTQRERERRNRAQERNQAGISSAIRGNLKSNQAISQLRGAISLIDAEINRAERAGIGMDPDRAELLSKERTKYMGMLDEALMRGSAGTGLGISEGIRALTQPGARDVDDYESIALEAFSRPPIQE